MEKYDLHIHSSWSDGDFEIKDIIDKIRAHKIKIFSITDHDSLKSMDEVN